MNPKKKPVMPNLPSHFLRWYCSPQVLESLEGDLYELYLERLRQHGRFKADLYFTLEVIDLCRPFAYKKRSLTNSSIPLDMIQYYIKIAWRNLAKQKVYSFIKISGFAIGLAACFLIFLFIKDELSFDRHLKEGERVYRLVGNDLDPEDSWRDPYFPGPIGMVLKSDFPEIELATRLVATDFGEAGENQFRSSDQTENNYEEGFVYADPEFLEIFEIPMILGSRADALSKPNSIILSKSKADKYFPDQNPVGKTVVLNEDTDNPYTIGGVMNDFPTNSHLNCSFILTLTEKEFWPGEQTSWGSNNYYPYFKIKKGVNPVQFEKKLNLIVDNYIVPYRREKGDPKADDVKKYLHMEMQKVEEVYLYSKGITDQLRHGDIVVLRLFGVIALFILLLAIINFVNLSTAKTDKRSREVGLQKVLGSNRRELIGQFLAESFLYCLVSVILGLAISWFFLPLFNSVTEKSLQLPWTAWWLVPGLLVLTMIVGVLAGFYPAIFLSGFKPYHTLKGAWDSSGSKSRFRSSLVIFQFTTSIVLIICTLITTRQMDFILHKKLGYDKDQLIILHGTNTLGQQQSDLKNELLRLPSVKYVSLGDYLPVSGGSINYNPWWKGGRTKEDPALGAQIWRVDKDYLNTLDIKIVAGRNFNEEILNDSQAIIINQNMANKLNFEDPINQIITNGFQPDFHIIGVVQDFHFQSLRKDIESLCLVLGNESSSMLIKADTKDMTATLFEIGTTWSKFLPGQSIRYEFLDDRYSRMYADVIRSSRVFSLFAALAVFVACLGLFALSAFMVEQRAKEIGIRKVLGATLGNIFNVLTKNFIKLVIIAFFIAAPIGWYLMSKWLQDFKYRVSITWDVFIMAGLIALLIAVVTISYETLKAAMTSPIKGIRSE